MVASGAAPSKGWVRDGILSLLAKSPGTATEIANKLGVSKATISYHTKALIRRDMIEIADIKSIRGGVYSKTYSLKRGGLVLVRRKGEREGSLTNLDEWFERLLMSWHLEPRRKPSDEIEIFLYHLFRILAESDSLDEGIFEEFGHRVGNTLISPSLKFATMKGGLKELAEYLGVQDMAQVTVEIRKGQEPRLVCMGCFQNKEYGGLVCSFTKGMLTGAIAAKRGGRPHLERSKQEGAPGCLYSVKMRGSTT
ncbi:MAG: winged helix-turn-helix domain-containing protein [Thaumarchaeota archaeon]|nr:winged helix-turn-helix domain-containing protein [Nitrososphaerota archaeon]